MSPLQDADLAAAVALGWRVAELYSLVDDDHDCSPDTLLPAHCRPCAGRSARAPAARGGRRRQARGRDVEARVARRAGRRRARERRRRHVQREAFRTQLRACHVEINKDLWSMNEALGKAYELGNGLSDTYGRVCRGYREPGADHALIWKRVFDEGRIERLKKLLDDLQSRLDATAVSVVREQLDSWRDEVEKPHRGGRPACARQRAQGPAPPDRDLAPADRGRQAARGVPGRRAARPRPGHAARPRLEALPHVAAAAGGRADRC